MIQSKLINKIIVALMITAVLVVTVVIGVSNYADNNNLINDDPEYTTAIFGVDIISVEILADEEQWQEMLDNATAEEYIMVDVIVNGVTFEDVGIRPKGNSSLTQVAATESDRYSFRIQFDEYISGQTCFGLESFVINNMTGDNTYMKEYISYELMEEAGVETPYYGYADVSLNGETWGLYLAVEMYNDSYEQRVYDTTLGTLYNVKMQNGNDEATTNITLPEGFEGNTQFNPEDLVMPEGEDITTEEGEATADPSVDPTQQNGQGTRPDMSENANARTAGGMGGMGGSSTGGSLVYTDDNSASYSAIFSNVVGNDSDESDYQRVITALEALSTGEDLETYFDVDQILKYLAAHTIVVNLDSYSSSMAQNYYIYEMDGQLTILPWDYNLAWGGFQSGDASSVVNFPIDTPVSGVEMSERPLLEQLLGQEEYLQTYHEILQQLVDDYFADGKFEAKVNELSELISEYVKNDPTAFCTYEEYTEALDTFITLGELRAESVQGQLDGTVPSTTEAQSENAEALISSESVTLSKLGSMTGGNRTNQTFENVIPGSSTDQTEETTPEMPTGQVPQITPDASTDESTGESADESTEQNPLITPGVDQTTRTNWNQMQTTTQTNNYSSFIYAGIGLVLILGVLVTMKKMKRNY